MSHLNNVGLRHNKTVESIMLIFTQFPTTCCLDIILMNISFQSAQFILTPQD